MKKLTEKEIQNEAERIRREYAYMDTMPFEGWMWEFIRRNKSYQRDVSRIRQQEEGADLDDYGLLFQFVGSLEGINEKHFVSGLLDGSDDEDNQYRFYITPDPEIPYYAFDDNSKPPIANVFFTITTPEEIEDKLGPNSPSLHIFEPYDPERMKFWVKMFKGYDNFLKGQATMFLMSLLKWTPKTDLIVVIDRNARKTDIEKYLLPEIKKRLTPKPKRNLDNKWKYYLIVYDLKDRDEGDKTFEQIADIMLAAFPEIPVSLVKTGTKSKKFVESCDYFNPQNCSNFHKSAIALINGGYREFLYPSESRSLKEK